MKKIITALIIMVSISAFSQKKNNQGIPKDDTTSQKKTEKGAGKEPASAKKRTVTGKITDDTGEPLFGANLYIKKTGTGTTTDFDGKFTIAASTGDIITVSYLGAKTINVVVNESDFLNIKLKILDQELDEVVVIGYGKVKKSDLTGSVSSIKADDITKTATISLDQALAGRAAGVIVTSNSGAPGAGASITIRGISTITNSEPLYVIDGIPMENESLDALSADSNGGNNLSPLSLINPDDIASIEILKDASATAIYGSRGSNGVVLVTTKTGKVGKGVISVSRDYSIGTIPHVSRLLNANEFVILSNELNLNSGSGTVDPLLLADAQAGNLITTDWLKTVTHPSTTTNTNLSFSGGTKDVRYLFSQNFLDSEGMIATTNFSRVQTRLNLDADVNDLVKLGSRITYSYVDSDSQSTNVGQNADGYGVGNIIRRVLEADPTKSIYQTLTVNDPDNPDAEDIQINPLDYLNNNKWSTKEYQFLGSGYLTLQFSKAFSFKSTFNYQNRYSKQRFYQNREVRPGLLTTFGGWAKTGDSQNESISNVNEFHYDKTFGKHAFNSVLGQSIEYRTSDRVATDNRGFANDLLTIYAPSTATTHFSDDVSTSENKLLSYFGRINYTFDKKFLFTFTGRYDGSSKFAANNKWAFFPAAAIGYKISEEKFLKDIPEITQAKLRVSYGKTGNQAITDYQSLAVFTPDLYDIGNGAGGESTTSIYYSDQIPNPNLKWETTHQLDAGIDLGFFKNRVTITADYYSKNTTDLLFRSNKVAAQSGQSNFVRNLGSIKSTGFELDLGLDIIKKKNFSWLFNGNFSVGQAIINDLPTEIAAGVTLSGVAGTGTQRLINGQKVGTFYGFKRAGIAQFSDFAEFQGLTNQQQIDLYNTNRSGATVKYTYIPRADGAILYNEANPSPGKQLFFDTNGDKTISEEDKQVIGNAQADVMFGIKNDFRIGNIDFSFFFDAQLGQEIANTTNVRLMSFTGDRNALAVVKDSWSSENQDSILPKLGSYTRNFNDMYVEDGSFVRLQNVTVGYNFDKKLIARAGLNSLRLYASLNNIYTFTKYSGFSPDVSTFGKENLSIGHDSSGYPNIRRLVFGAKLAF